MDYLELAERFGVLMKLNKLVQKKMDIKVFEVKLDVPMQKAISMIAKNKNMTMKSISQKIGIEKGSFVTATDMLIEEKLVTRVRSKSDRRVIMLELTERGQCIANKIDEMMAEQITILFSDLSDDQVISFYKNIDEAASIIEKLEKR